MKCHLNVCITVSTFKCQLEAHWLWISLSITHCQILLWQLGSPCPLKRSWINSIFADSVILTNIATKTAPTGQLTALQAFNALKEKLTGYVMPSKMLTKMSSPITLQEQHQSLPKTSISIISDWHFNMGINGKFTFYISSGAGKSVISTNIFLVNNNR